jgi:PAS domain S-box-containing protein
MSPAPVTPSGVERAFGADEIIVTKTDLKGRITYANDVFLRVSAYDEADVVGQPHSLIRHPDMPRGVFRLLWQTLEERRELFAYVVNLAGDGAHYWVFAHVTPSLDDAGRVVGYHSNRRSPNRGAIRVMADLYADMRAEERRHSRASDAAAAGLEVLARTLAERGATYDELIWSLNAEDAA